MMSYEYALSIIIPTRNRCAFLRDALDSLKSEVAGNIPAEIIVIDNGSSDSTRDVVAAFAATSVCPVVYRYEARPGLHVGRHLAADLSRAPLLAYLDDDVIVQPGWLRAVVERFGSDARIALVGGPCRPLWEASPPSWIESFRDECLGGWCLGQLSLLDFGCEAKVIPAQYVFGCNYCIRKDILYQFGGFHPDGVPAHLLKFRGDGETGLAVAIGRSNEQVWYEPRASIGHRVPLSRLTAKYFHSIAHRNGISVAYSTLRERQTASPKLLGSHMLRLLKVSKSFSIRRMQGLISKGELQSLPTRQSCDIVFYSSFIMQFIRFMGSKQVREWTLQADYFDIDKLPYTT